MPTPTARLRRRHVRLYLVSLLDLLTMNCPLCRKPIPFNTLHVAWQRRDRPVAFTFPCPLCRATCIVDVRTTPDFYLYDPLTCSGKLSNDLDT